MSFITGGNPPERVLVGGVSWSDHWIMVENLWVLWGSGAMRGRDRVIGHAAGVRAKPRRTAVTTAQLQVAVTGKVTRAGAPSSDAATDLRSNMAYLRHQCVDTADKGGLNLAADGTRNVELQLADGYSATLPAHVGPLVVTARMANTHFCTCDFSFPEGLFVLTEAAP